MMERAGAARSAGASMSHPDTVITPNIMDFDALGRANINGFEAAAQFKNRGDDCHL
jgi:hypothetical protein